MPQGTRPTSAMVLAAGLGMRMRPITLTLPKPLVEVGGRAMLDRALDRLAEAGVETAVVNVHHLAERVEEHLAGRARPRIVISDERDMLMDTGGGLVRALPHLGRSPFFLLNSDSFWLEDRTSNLAAMAAMFDAEAMDAVLLLVPVETAIGYDGPGDFDLDSAGRLIRRPSGGTAPYVYTGVALVDPSALAGAPEGPFSLNLVIDQSLRAGRMFGRVIDGLWLHVGTPGAIAEAERAIGSFAA